MRGITANENMCLIQRNVTYRTTYCTRDEVNKYDRNMSGNCFKCRITDFWVCGKIQRIWFDIERWLSEILELKFNFNLSVCIFLDVTGYSEVSAQLDYSFFINCIKETDT